MFVQSLMMQNGNEDLEYFHSFYLPVLFFICQNILFKALYIVSPNLLIIFFSLERYLRLKIYSKYIFTFSIIL